MADLQIAEIQQRLNFIAKMEVDAKSNHGFEKASFHSDKVRKERERLQVLFKRHGLIDKQGVSVEPGDLEGYRRSFLRMPPRQPFSCDASVRWQ